MRTWGLLVRGCGLALVAPLVVMPVPGAGSTQSLLAAEAVVPPARPNIIVVMADDMRADDLVFAPRILKLVSERGVTFKNAFSPFPLCCPARASFLTGLFAHNHGVLWHKPPYGYGSFDDSTTLATSLSDAGYTTGYVGKYLNRYGPDRSLVTGRPSFDYVPNGWSDWRATIDANKHVPGTTYNYLRTPFNVNGEVDTTHFGEYQTEVVGTMAREMVTKMVSRSAPFFAVINFLAPHVGEPDEHDDIRSVVDDRGRRQKYLTPARPTWVRGKFDQMVRRGSGMPKGGGPSEREISDQPWYFSRQPEPNRQERAALREVTRQRAESMFVMDREIGALVRQLKRDGTWADTIFVFTSDNGYYLGEHRRRTGKVQGHDPSTRVPLLITGPGLRAVRTTYDPISTVDLTATILDLADAEPPAEPDGRSLVSTLYASDSGWRVPMMYEAVYTGRPEPGRGFSDARTSIGVRTARYTYIRNHRGTDMLYDLKRDPLQNLNVAGKARYRAVQAELDAVWHQMRDCAGPSCQVTLPPALATSPTEAASLGRAYWSEVMRVYGFDPKLAG